MHREQLLKRLFKGLIVSCQAEPFSALRSPLCIAAMAQDAILAGAVGIRADGPENIRAIRGADCRVPIIGIDKDYTRGEVFITPTLEGFDALVKSGAEIIALDATGALRPGGLSLKAFVLQCRALHPQACLFADCSTPEEARRADALGFDFISPTLAGYTPQSTGAGIETDDFRLFKNFSSAVTKARLVAEGNFSTPERARRALELGAFAVVTGNAITNVHYLTQQFIEEMHHEGTGSATVY